MIKAIVFDFFGVLVGDGFEATYSGFGGDPRKDKSFIQELLDQANRGEISSEEFRTKICEHIGISLEEYQRSIKNSEAVNFELLEYIKELKPRYKTAILSNASKDGLERRISLDTLEKYFDVMIVSAEVGYIKPEPEIYELAARELGVKPEECVFIDDRQGYAAAARDAGMQAIFFQNFPQMKQDLEEILEKGKGETANGRF